MEVLGKASVQVSYQNREKKFLLIIVAEEGPKLFGRNWLKHICLNWKSICAIQAIEQPTERRVQQLLSTYFEMNWARCLPQKLNYT